MQEDLTDTVKWEQLLGVEVLINDAAGDMPYLRILSDDKWISAPNFTESLDACITWLVPKLIEQGIDWSLHGAKLSFARLLKPCVKAWESKAVDGDKPALALCLAIEKLIDEGK